ncbi:unnamed protein product [Sphagnum tenellum]
MERVKTFATRLKVIMHVEDGSPAPGGSVSNLQGSLDNRTAVKTASEPASDSGSAPEASTDSLDSPDFPAFHDSMLSDPEKRTLLKEYTQLENRISKVGSQALETEEQLQDEYEILYDKKAFLAALPTRQPAAGYFTSGFGIRNSPYGDRIKMHEGLDIANRLGTLIHAPADGAVTFADSKAGYGLTLVLNHGYGIETWYGHLKGFIAKKGENIKRGAQIALLGNSGRSTGPHVHYESFPYSVQLSAYADSACTQSAPGTLTTPTNPLGFTGGIATFDQTTYTLSGSTEGAIYFQGNITGSPETVFSCGYSHAIIQHFNAGVGSLAFASSGLVGNATESLVLDQAATLRITPTGAYIVAGSTKNAATSGTELGLVRYLPNGNLDTSFNTTGFVTEGTSTGAAGASGAQELDQALDLKVDSLGRYVVLGTSFNAVTGGNQMAVWRYQSNGTLDSQFATSGVFVGSTTGLTGRFPAQDSPEALILDQAGNIIITGGSLGQAGGEQLFVARLTSSGVLDPTFGSGGVFTPGTTGAAGGVGASESDFGNSLGIAANGNYIIAGSSAEGGGGGRELALWKVLSSGEGLDTSFGSTSSGLTFNGIAHFGSQGVALGSGGNLADTARSIQIDSSDNIIVTGSSRNPSGGTEMILLRYLSNGGLDTTFGSSLSASSGPPLLSHLPGAIHFSSDAGAAGATGANENDVGVSLGIDPTYGFYIIAGTSKNSSGGEQVAIWSFNPDGTLNKIFALSGWTTSSSLGLLGGQTSATVKDIARSLQTDPYGTYVIAGSTQNSSGGTQLALWRYLLNGVPDL